MILEWASPSIVHQADTMPTQSPRLPHRDDALFQVIPFHESTP